MRLRNEHGAFVYTLGEGPPEGRGADGSATANVDVMSWSGLPGETIAGVRSDIPGDDV
jgi:hypothetical protein